MVNSQEWLDKNYPEGKRTEITEIYGESKDLEGKLVIEGFDNLERILCEGNSKLTDVNLNNLPKLKHFDTKNCGIKAIRVSGCPEIGYFRVSNNYLSDLNFLDELDPEKLRMLSIHSNNFAKQDLSFLEKFSCLEELYINNYDKEKFDKGICNRFYGSLEPLFTMSNLRWLNIGNIEVKLEFKYLSNSVERIYHDQKLHSEKSIVEQIEKHKKKDQWGSYYDYQEWRKNNFSLVKEWDTLRTNKWLDKKWPEKERKNIKVLEINDRRLAGKLNLKDFENLETLKFENDQIVSLDLSKCEKLTNFTCHKSKFYINELLQSLPNKERLERLDISENKNISNPRNLEFLVPFIELKVLNVENCPLEGSLKYLKEMKGLEQIYISHTDLKEGIEDLPESCKWIYCDFHYKSNHKSVKIARELGKHLELGDDVKYYNLAKWKEEQRSGIASVIPLERLYVIRGNMKKFLDKWGEEVKTKQWWKIWEKNGKDKLSTLWIPEEFSKNWWLITGIQWTNRAASVVGGSLLLIGTSQNNDQYTETGGIIAIVAPFIETVTSQMNDKIWEVKQEEWKEFESDVENLWDNLYELIGIIEPIKDSLHGKEKVDKALSDLDKAIYSFLEEYDEDRNGQVDINELENARKKLTEGLRRNWVKRDDEECSGKENKLSKIVEAIRELEKEVTEYRKAFYRWARQKEVEEERKRRKGKKNDQDQLIHTAVEIVDDTNNSPEKMWKHKGEEKLVKENNQLMEISPK